MQKNNQKDSITIRRYHEKDARSLSDIYFYTIHNINIHDYSKKQINAWAPKSCLELEGWKKKWEKLPPIVATTDNGTVESQIIFYFICHFWYKFLLFLAKYVQYVSKNSQNFSSKLTKN